MNNKQFVVLVIITFSVGMIWLVADIIFNTKASIPVSPKLQTLLEEVSPNFNERVLETIAAETLEKNLVPESEVDISLPAPSPSTAPITPTIPSSSPSGELRP